MPAFRPPPAVADAWGEFRANLRGQWDEKWAGKWTDSRPAAAGKKTGAALVKWDGRGACWANGACRLEGVRAFFAVVSNLGNGKFWYLFMATLGACAALDMGPDGAGWAAAHMLLAGGLTCLIYKACKRVSRRPRPYAAIESITVGAVPLDTYSFPSGHTMHAVAFTVVAAAHLPAAGPPLAVASLLVAASRVVLGLHYPTDVALGGLLGFLIAELTCLPLG